MMLVVVMPHPSPLLALSYSLPLLLPLLHTAVSPATAAAPAVAGCPAAAVCAWRALLHPSAGLLLMTYPGPAPAHAAAAAAAPAALRQRQSQLLMLLPWLLPVAAFWLLSWMPWLLLQLLPPLLQLVEQLLQLLPSPPGQHLVASLCHSGVTDCCRVPAGHRVKARPQHHHRLLLLLLMACLLRCCCRLLPGTASAPSSGEPSLRPPGNTNYTGQESEKDAGICAAECLSLVFMLKWMRRLAHSLENACL
jgi:hypothetical protein